MATDINTIIRLLIQRSEKETPALSVVFPEAPPTSGYDPRLYGWRPVRRQAAGADRATAGEG